MEDKILTIYPHHKRIQMYDTGGKISRYMKLGIPYEKPLLEHIKAQEFSGVIVDAGANIGNHTLWFSVVCGLRVVAFEPLYHELLKKHVELNRVSDLVQIEPVALGRIEDSRARHRGKGRLDSSGKGIVPIEDVPDVASGKRANLHSPITMRALDSYQLTNVCAIKADVEGMESYVLLGGERTIKRDHPVIYAEEWTKVEHKVIAEVLEPWGYHMTKLFHSKGVATPVGEWKWEGKKR